MKVLGDRFDIVVGVWIEVISTLAMLSSTLDHVKQMWNYTSRNECVSDFVEVDSPRVAGSMREDFKFVSHRMVPPDASVDRYPLVVRRSGFANA